jgi:hypothetical protein
MDSTQSMSKLQELIEKNDFSIYDITDVKFLKYGKILDSKKYPLLYKAISSTEIPEVGNVYVRDANIKAEEEKILIEKEVYGFQEVEIGYCNGHSHQLNALEYHMCREVNFAGTDLVLLLGKKEDIKQTYPSKNVEAFFIPQGSLFYLETNVLHFAPCAVSNFGFKCLVILLDRTNSQIENPHDYDSDLLMFNKWIICHPENTANVNKGVRSIITGDNIILNY